ncbi:MAG: hypothetical protein HUN04_19515 [Desulfobacter sp.]|nr:MAG: hypothetical protein HUN04_19515 [Desulfobacter sp.]
MTRATLTFRHREKAIAEHERLSRLFRENRFLFELERKQAIEKTIGRVKKEALKKELRRRQDKWDRILDHSGNTRNRLALMEMLLWDAVRKEWLPTLNKV